MANTTIRRPPSDDEGFSLIEVMIAMAILATGLLSLAGVFALGLNHLAGSSAALIAREKAREAVESVHTARDTRVIVWCQVYNVNSARSAACAAAAPGVFLDEPQPLRNPGPDGLVNTADDEGLEESLQPGPDNQLGTEDDIRTPLSTYTRQIEITEIMTGDPPAANTSLRRLRVTIGYKVGSSERTYVLTTYISSIS
jgi:prepilin-type N-terminal cleavage/methylation domain-containing protein